MRRNRLDMQVERALLALMEAEDSAKVLHEQVVVWTNMRDEFRTRSLVAETPLASAEFDDMERQLAVASAALGRQREEIVARRGVYEELLEEWQPEGAV